MIESPLLRYVHPNMVYHRTPLADEDNGLALLRAAGEAVVDPTEIWDVTYSRIDCECGAKDCLSCNYDHQQMLPRLKQILERNSQALELYGQVLKKGKLQFPELTLAPWFGGSPLNLRIELWQLKGLETWWAAEQGDLPQAARAARERAQFTAIFARGGGSFGDYILVLSEQRAVLRAALRLIDNPGINHAALDELERLCERLLTDADFAQALRVDFLLALKQIELVDRETNADGRIDVVLEHFYEQRPSIADGEAWDDEGRLAERRRQLHLVLKDHPNLWDAGESVRALSNVFAYYCSENWQATAADERRWAEFWQHWPGQLQSQFSIEAFGTSPSAAAALTEDQEFYPLPQFAPVSAEELETARQLVRMVHNPLGVLVEHALWPMDLDDLRQECAKLGKQLRSKLRWRKSLLGRLASATRCRMVRLARRSRAGGRGRGSQ